MTAYPATLRAIEARLRTAQRRVRTRLCIDATVWAGAAGLLVAAALVAVHRFGPHSSLDWLAGGSEPYWAIGGVGVLAAAAVLAVMLPMALRRTPTLDLLARRADSVFDLQERVSTAMELAAAPAEDALRAALAQDAARRADAIDPRALAPIQLPRAAWLVPALGVTLATLLLMPGSPPVQNDPSVVAGNPADAPMTASEREAAARQIAKAADLVEITAAEQANETLAAIARTLDALEQQVLATAEPDRGEIVAELDRLADYAREGATPWDAETGATISDMIDAAALEIDPSIAPSRSTEARSGDTADKSQQAAKRGSDEAALGKTRAGAEQTSRQGYEAGQMSTAVDKMKEFNVKNTGEDAGPSGEGTPTEADSDYFSIVEREAQRQTQRADMLGDFPPGQTGEFTDPMANPWGGESTQSSDADLAIGKTDLPDAGFDPNAELMLEASAAAAGERTRKDRPPIARFTAVDDRGSPASNPVWMRSPEAQVSRDWLTPGQRDVVGAYFMAINAEAAK